MTGHARLAPSSAERWVNCAAAPSLEPLFPSEDSDESLEGTAAHWHLSERLSKRSGDRPDITDEMRDLAEPLIADIMSLTDGGFGLHVEELVTASQIHPECWGTPDCWALTIQHGLLIWDYKFGHGFVDAHTNFQLVAYMQGILEQYPTLPMDTRFRAVIYQPRNYHKDGPFRVWEGTLSDLEHYVGVMQRAAVASDNPHPVATTGPHCKNCKGRLGCHTFIQSALNGVDVAEYSPPVDLTAPAKSKLMQIVRTASERLKAMELALEAQVIADIRSGKKIPGWGVEQGYGREKWTQPVEDIIALGALFGHDLAKPTEAITPAQARKLGIDESVIKEYSIKPKGELKLVVQDERAVARRFG